MKIRAWLTVTLVGLALLSQNCIFIPASPPPSNPTEGQIWTFTDKLLDFNLKPDKTLDTLYFRKHTIVVSTYTKSLEYEVIDWEAMLHKGHNYKITLGFRNGSWAIDTIQDLEKAES